VEYFDVGVLGCDAMQFVGGYHRLARIYRLHLWSYTLNMEIISSSETLVRGKTTRPTTIMLQSGQLNQRTYDVNFRWGNIFEGRDIRIILKWIL
jgi:hypothetical protein